MLRLMLLILFAVGLASPAQALTQAEIVSELIGALVYSTDGQEVGTVAEIISLLRARLLIAGSIAECDLIRYY
jgi:hypothetical protein